LFIPVALMSLFYLKTQPKLCMHSASIHSTYLAYGRYFASGTLRVLRHHYSTQNSAISSHVFPLFHNAEFKHFQMFPLTVTFYLRTNIITSQKAVIHVALMVAYLANIFPPFLQQEDLLPC